MQRIFIAFFLIITILGSIFGLGFDLWSRTDGFLNFANSTIQSAANESGATLNLEKGRADLRIAGLLIFFTITTMAWMPIVGIAIRAKVLDEDLLPNPTSQRKFRIAMPISIGLWITNLVLILRS